MNREYFQLLYPDMWLYTAATGLEKMTALALYWHIFGRSRTRYLVLALAGCVVWWMFARVRFSTFHLFWVLMLR